MKRRRIQNRGASSFRSLKKIARQIRRRENDARAIPEVEHDRDSKVVRHGEHPENAVRGRDAEALVCSCDAVQKGFVGKRDAFGMASGAGSESNEGGFDFSKGLDPLRSRG